MVDPLAPLLADGVIDAVVSKLKSGKEADLWLVRHGAELVAAKVYKARESRSFRNDAAYREGRRVRDTRMQRAMDRGSRFGQAAAEEAWKAKEADALYALHAAGVRVPRPVMFYEGVLLMELVVDAHGHPAPRLIDAHLGRDQAAALYADLRGQVVRMLGCDLVHGDLSPYNVLLGRDGPVVIDFPQVIGAAHNSQAERFLVRDVENLRHFFAALDPALHASSGDGAEIWRAYARRELTPDFVPTGRAPEPRRAGGHGAGPRPAAPAGRPERREPQRHGGQADRRERQPPHAQAAREQPRPPPHGGSAARPPPRAEPQRRPEPDRRRDADRRRGAPAPEVVRVVRPLAGGTHGKPTAPHAHGGTHGKPGAPHAQGGSHGNPAAPHAQGGSHGNPAAPHAHAPPPAIPATHAHAASHGKPPSHPGEKPVAGTAAPAAGSSTGPQSHRRRRRRRRAGGGGGGGI
ncbi:RIO1 family regulatory kinase/ATPase domain-containing protein [Anaeromyxobacter oryzae]|uniref:non-specific serine/threonine protein kinase n=1 Tax=Anaeromyxobacter oryzae TaxID=2918170 RepID=A0ABN6MWA0_9BACT|nr:RIO1 family regulatory kinase/ATPase [Anaeromyxobacter oryzae]BDG05216.1 hypothetical protein AMOR_42120 [Anaeromyxobacter oryzae]